MNEQEALKEAYKILSPFSDKQLWEFNSNLLHLKFLKKYLPKNGEILDVGCGIGILLLALKLLGYKIIGMDKYVFLSIDTTYAVKDLDLEKLKSIWMKYGIRIIDRDVLVEKLDRKYDSVISIAVIEHQRLPKLFLGRLIDYLKPAGILYIATPNITNFSNRIRFLLGRSPVDNIKEFFDHGENFAGHFREYTLRELKEMFTWSGLEIIEARNIQAQTPRFRRNRSVKDWLKSLFIIIAQVFSGIICIRDNNIIIGKK